MTTINAKLVALTQPTIGVGAGSAEGLVAYCAKVSNPANQDSPDYERLLAYCVRNKHWSVFEMANAVVEVEAPRDITRQLLRHRSFSFQEFSQRYSDQIEFTDREFRRQDSKNRQNSTNDLDEDTQDVCNTEAYDYRRSAEIMYHWMRGQNVAKECARVILPEGLTMSRLYVNGTLRSWIHYLDVRDDEGVTQWEHVVLARKIKEVLLPAFPTVFGLLENK
ncbi:THY1 Predicted alternative thymidylate synthase [uncultured Caudovirales phage]|uniref:THY1 Predicted alternative thymidylate synthase n=1 Tax=uncultured Caudovirales phage TaxID=2100421 RepID=A0A6J5T8N6_9CAUD|nr:THY1 Predicted alternative thymidylate synthase [uncultured Caudovirales phage]